MMQRLVLDEYGAVPDDAELRSVTVQSERIGSRPQRVEQRDQLVVEGRQTVDNRVAVVGCGPELRLATEVDRLVPERELVDTLHLTQMGRLLADRHERWRRAKV